MSTETSRYLRFSIPDRVEHWLQILTFIPLAVTGLVQRFSSAWLSEQIIRGLGGIEPVRFIHRGASVVVMLAGAYHVGTAGHRIFVRRAPKTMTPGRGDLRAAWQSLDFALGRRDSPPKQGRFTWPEKYEYWAIVWGTTVMTITGFILWNPIATVKLLPGDFIPVAKAIHGNEAVLAVLVITVWHFYHVHIAHWNTSIFTGYMSREGMLREHALELEAIESGGEQDRIAPAGIKRRQRIFIPVYGAIAAALLVGIYLVVTFEETAIGTIEPSEQTAIFAPIETSAPEPSVTPTATSQATSPTTTATSQATSPTTTATSWDADFSGLLAGGCGGCHSAANPMGGLDVTSYQAVLAGGVGGPGVVPGDPDASHLLITQAAGGHLGQLTDAELDALRAWIEAGAPEQAATPTTTSEPAP